MSKAKIATDREILVRAQQQGRAALWKAYVRLSGPGWLQSAITLGGGSLSGALFLGVLGGTDLLWLQLMAITMGVIMLSAISYVTLSTGRKPFQAINQHINPVLGCGWLLATSTANMIWCMPQFSLSFDALNKNLVPGGIIPEGANEATALWYRVGVSAILFVLALALVVLNERRGRTARVFDVFLKMLVGMVVICFFGVVIYLLIKEGLPWADILSGFIPKLSQWSEPTGTVAELVQQAPEAFQQFWKTRIVSAQRDVMIGAAATAVGINMTFLLPYSMLARGWDKPFRGLARFDLATGMAIPYVIVTACVVIAAAYSFHGKVDEAFLSTDPAVMETSPIYGGALGQLEDRVKYELGWEAFLAADQEQRERWREELQQDDARISDEQLQERIAPVLGATLWQQLSPQEQQQRIASLSEADKILASTLVKRNAFQLSQSLSPLLGERISKLVFGLGVLGMGFSTIIILMLINGYVFRELAPQRFERSSHFVGCLVAGTVGMLWPVVWRGESEFWLGILTSTFGMILLPIAYVTFFFMMNNRDLLGDDMPRGVSRLVWNVLMAISVAGATIAAGSSIYTKMSDPVAGPTIVGITVFFLLLTAIGFAATPRRSEFVEPHDQ
ncbi:MAG: hypothetical protein KatS3mg111_2211 [Pirellulaceae bacterium]|nr:MAG: hypothetical protein KatS3mg111_2211 [Pirellulaceae bacterium]